VAGGRPAGLATDDPQDRILKDVMVQTIEMVRSKLATDDPQDRILKVLQGHALVQSVLACNRRSAG